MPKSVKLKEDDEFVKRYGKDPSWLENPDCNFLMSLCWIARTPKVQFDLWDTVRKVFTSPEYGGDIRNIKTKNYCQKMGYYKKLVPYDWLPNMAKHLRYIDLSFSQFLDTLKPLNGIEVRNKFTEILGIESLRAKRISVFIRDFLEKNVFPIDSNVEYVLTSLGLPNNEELLVKLCEGAAVDPKLFERQLYAHGQEICGYGKQCVLKGVCVSSLLNITNRCNGRKSRYKY
ncbi:hypothetical protein MUO79_09815 [Candidatus Bathyarchaeota archaeon]|nr:hypothetical protein [Candidatus Bathyarchaeota archaeon]